jgi:hypothetical protein
LNSVGRTVSSALNVEELAMVSLTDQGRSRLFKIQISNLNAAAKNTAAQCTVRPSSEIHNDALRAFRTALREGYTHHYQVFDKDSSALRWVHTLISNVKTFLLGTCHGLGKKHLQSYFDEFSFRFIRRFWPDQIFPRLVCAVAASNILGYVDLMG